jgi:hypothetical protein
MGLKMLFYSNSYLKDMDSRFDTLADYLSDHLWQRNSLDYDFLKSFPEFTYQGIGYRVLFLDQYGEPDRREYPSFAKTKNGVKEYIYNAQNYDKDFVLNKKPYIFKSQIEGFDIHLALLYFKKNGGLTENTIKSFIDEEEVIAYSHSKLTLVEDL